MQILINLKMDGFLKRKKSFLFERRNVIKKKTSLILNFPPRQGPRFGVEVAQEGGSTEKEERR